MPLEAVWEKGLPGYILLRFRPVFFMNNEKYLMINIKKLLTMVKMSVIVHLTINIKYLTEETKT